jgi:hypothetical protein
MDTIWSNEQDEHEEKNMITHIKSSGAISMSPELFEKVYEPKGDYHRQG